MVESCVSKCDAPLLFEQNKDGKHCSCIDHRLLKERHRWVYFSTATHEWMHWFATERPSIYNGRCIRWILADGHTKQDCPKTAFVCIMPICTGLNARRLG